MSYGFEDKPLNVNDFEVFDGVEPTVEIKTDKPYKRKPKRLFMVGSRVGSNTSSGLVSDNGDDYRMLFADLRLSQDANGNQVYRYVSTPEALKSKDSWSKVEDEFERYLLSEVKTNAPLEIHSSGMLGADMIWAKAAMKVKKRLEKMGREPSDYVRLVLDVPYSDLGDNWKRSFLSKEDKDNGLTTDMESDNQYLLRVLKKNADAVVTYYDVDARAQQAFEKDDSKSLDEYKVLEQEKLNRNRNAILDARNKAVVSQSDEGVSFVSGGSDSLENSMVADAQAQGLNVRTIDPDKFGFKYVSNNVRNRTQSQSSVSENSTFNVSSVTERVETIYVPSPEHQSYDNDLERKEGRYWWRNPNVSDESPVTVNELMKAINVAIPNSGRRNDIRTLLTRSLTDPNNSENSNSVSPIISSKIGDNWYDMSPSDVETIVTVLTLVNDAGLDYSVDVRNNSLQLVLNDNNHSRITLVNPANPQLTGQVSGRTGAEWSTRLGYLTYKRDGEENSRAIAPVVKISDDGSLFEEDPFVRLKGEVSRFANSHKTIETMRAFGDTSSDDTEYMQLLARARYTGLDQDSKNKLAIVNVVEALGIDPSGLSSKMRQYVQDSKFETKRYNNTSRSSVLEINHINLGDGHKADIASVDVIEPKGNDSVTRLDKDNPIFAGGPVQLNLSNASTINVFNESGTLPAVDPFSMSKDEANQLIAEGVIKARVNYLHKLTGEDLTHVNEQDGKAQDKFRQLLADKHSTLQLDPNDESSMELVKVEAEPLSIDDQKNVLKYFTEGIINTKYVDGKIESKLAECRAQMIQDWSDAGHDTRSYEFVRQINAFDNLVEFFDSEIGNPDGEMIVNRLGEGLRLDEYKNRYMNSISGKSKDYCDAKSKEFDELVSKLDSLFVNNFDGVDDTTLSVAHAFSLADLQRTFEDNVSDNNAVSELKDTVDKFYSDFGLKQNTINLTKVINETSDSSNSSMYEFNMAKALGLSKYSNNLRGNNDFDTNRIMERSVQFDPESAMTASQLRDLDNTGTEAELKKYIAEVASGEKEFSFNSDENPFPGAFKSNAAELIKQGGTGLLQEQSPNEFKARVLDKVESRLLKRGALPDTIEVQMDKNGLVSFKAELPQYNVFDHKLVNSGTDWAYDENGNIKVSVRGNAYIDTKSTSDKIRTVPISGTFGQVFAMDHDGIVRTNYNRFDEFDKGSLQQEFLPRYRGRYLLPERDNKGDWNKDEFIRESQTGLEHHSRLRLTGYEQAVMRELSQQVDNMLNVYAVGDVTRPNSNTIMNKLMHGGVLGESLPKTIAQAPVSADRQAKLETRLNTVRFNDSIGEATKTTEIIGFMNQYEREFYRKRILDGKVPDKYDVMIDMHHPMSVYGNRSFAELAHMSTSLYFSDNATGQGLQNGLTQVLGQNTKVMPNGRVMPNVFLVRDKTGKLKPLKDSQGKYVGYNAGSAIENMKEFDGGYKNSVDRQSVGKDQAVKSNDILRDVNVATMSLGAMTMEDGLVLSKAFAEKHKILDDNGNPRPLMIGDKISDPAGNKATVSFVIDPDMDFDTAEKEGLSDIVQLFAQNPDLEVVMNGLSQMSRNNGATAYNYVTNESSKPMSFVRKFKDGQGNIVAGDVVQTNATINKGPIILTDKTVDHAVTLYDGNSSNVGRKSGGLGMISDASKGAYGVANYFRNYKNGIVTWRRRLLTTGLDVDVNGLKFADFNELRDKDNIPEFSYDLNDKGNEIFNGVPSVITDDLKLERRVINNSTDSTKAKALVFDGLNDDSNLTQQSKDFLNSVYRHLIVTNPVVALNSDDDTVRKYNAGQDFLNQIPDDGILKLPESVSREVRFGGVEHVNDALYIVPRSLRNDTKSLDGTMISSRYNLLYSELGVKLAQLKLLQQSTEKLWRNDPVLKKQIDDHFVEKLGFQRVFDKIHQESVKYAFGSPNPKTSEYNVDVLAGKVTDSVTSQVSSNPMLPLDTIEISPDMAKKLGFVDGKDGFAHMKGHEDWNYLHVHRDPIWREQGSLAFRVKINSELQNCRINPAMASLLDADFDGDNLGLLAMKGDNIQKELRELCSVDKWMLDNHGVSAFDKSSNMLNIDAEIVDMARNTNNLYTVHTDSGDVTGHFLDKKFREDVLSKVRPDVQPSSWQKRLESGELDDAEFLNVIVNQAVKSNYANNDFIKARQDVDEIIQRTRGFNVSRDDKGEVVILRGEKSMLVDDGVDYTDKGTMYDSLMKSVNSGSKGSEKALEGLFKYMDKPMFSEMKAIGQKQLNTDGTLNEEYRQKYVNVCDNVHDDMLAAQRALKEKSDMTGVPGTIQKKITSVLMDKDDRALHAANAIGQAGTQKVLSIKREPIIAAQIAETLQVPIGSLLRGQYPVGCPRFSLMGAESDGRFGNNVLDVCDRVTRLNEIKFNNKDPLTLGNEDLANIAKVLKMDIDFTNDKQVQGFKDTLHEAVTPWIPESVCPKPTKDRPYLLKDEWVDCMSYLYIDSMKLDVNKEDFVILADALADENGIMQSIDDIIANNTKDSGFVGNLRQNGVSAIQDEMSQQDNDEHHKRSNPFGDEGSYERKALFGNMSDDKLTEMLNLSQTENPYNKETSRDNLDVVEDVKDEEQTKLLQEMHAIIKDSIVDSVMHEGKEIELPDVDVKTVKSDYDVSTSEIDDDIMNMVNDSLNSDNIDMDIEIPDMSSFESTPSYDSVVHFTVVQQANSENFVSNVNTVESTKSQSVTNQSVELNSKPKINVGAIAMGSDIMHPFKAHDLGGFDVSEGFEVLSINQFVAYKYLDKALDNNVGISSRDFVNMERNIMKLEDSSDLRRVMNDLNDKAFEATGENLINKADSDKFVEMGITEQMKQYPNLVPVYKQFAKCDDSQLTPRALARKKSIKRALVNVEQSKVQTATPKVAQVKTVDTGLEL